MGAVREQSLVDEAVGHQELALQVSELNSEIKFLAIKGFVEDGEHEFRIRLLNAHRWLDTKRVAKKAALAD